MDERRFVCPACGFPGLTESPWQDASASFEICPCCGLQFGYVDFCGGDAVRRPAFYKQWGAKWRDAGMAWSYPTAAPVGWDAEAQWRSFERTNQPRIQATSVRSLLEAACPGLAAAFEVEDEPGQERLLYVEMGAAARWLGAGYRSGDRDCLPAVFASVEHCIAEGSAETKNLVVIGLLEDLQNSNVTRISDAAVWEPYLGARSRAGWLAVSAMWEGDLQAFRDWASSEGIELP